MNESGLLLHIVVKILSIFMDKEGHINGKAVDVQENWNNLP